MKQNAICLFKGILFSTLIFTVLFLFLAFLMFQNGWGKPVMVPLLYISICLATFLGSFYFSKHAPRRRFLWGLVFGAVFFGVYVLASFLLNGPNDFSTDRIFTTLVFSLIAGMTGGMLS